MKKVFLKNNREKKMTNNKVKRKKKKNQTGRKLNFQRLYSMNLQANVRKTVVRGENHWIKNKERRSNCWNDYKLIDCKWSKRDRKKDNISILVTFELKNIKNTVLRWVIIDKTTEFKIYGISFL